jgi:hypothetical protein
LNANLQLSRFLRAREQNDRTEARAAMAGFCELDREAAPLTADFADEASKAPWLEMWNDCVAAAVNSGKARNPELGRAWVRARAAHIPPLHFFDEILEAGLPIEVRDAALCEFFQQQAAQNEHGAVSSLAKKHRELLRSSTPLWGTVGSALAGGPASNQQEAIDWLADWETRSNVEPWMLVNLAQALDAIEGPGAAAFVRRHLVEEAGPFHERKLQEIALGFWVALTGPQTRARELLGDHPARTLPAYYGFIKCLARAALHVHGAAAKHAGAWQCVEAEIKNARSVCESWPYDRGLRQHVSALAGTFASSRLGARLNKALNAAARPSKRVRVRWLRGNLWPVLIILVAALFAGSWYYLKTRPASDSRRPNNPAPEWPAAKLKYVPTPAPAGFRYELRLDGPNLEEVLMRESGDAAISPSELPAVPPGRRFLYRDIDGVSRPVLVHVSVKR